MNNMKQDIQIREVSDLMKWKIQEYDGLCDSEVPANTPHAVQFDGKWYDHDSFYEFKEECTSEFYEKMD